ncbi:MAG: alpha-amylase family glycosyl hydrolase, partial [bacterium]
MDALHDSRKLVYRSPFGALPLGEEVTLSIDVLDAEGVSCSLRLWIDGEGETLLPMEGTPIEGGTRFTITYKPAQTAVVWYFFQLRQGEEICWYGAKDGQTGGEGQLRWGGHLGSFQITVYEPRAVPDWYRKGIVYQIFPDRFRRDADWRKRTEQALSTPRAGIERRLVEDWYQRPRYERDGKGHILHWDFYGGSLRGIIEKLDYLKNLGITILYLNPIFEAASNHRYDTGDYELIDPILGTEEDFR